MLGEIHANSKSAADSIKKISDWCEEHEKKDSSRFMWGGVAILVVAAAAGVIPQLAAFAMEHLR